MPRKAASPTNSRGVTPSAYEQRNGAWLRSYTRTADGIRLGKSTSNLFRDRKAAPAARLDVRDFNNVLHVDPARG